MAILMRRNAGRFCGTCVLLLTALATQGQAAYDSVPNSPDHYTKRTAIFRAEKATTGRVIFLGNSITEGGNWKQLLHDSTVINRGISGDNSFGVLARLDEIVRHKPAKLFLMIGVNDLSKNIPNAVIIQNILNIVARIHSDSPKTAVYVQSILPVNPSHKKFPPQFNKTKEIEEINAQLAKYHEALKYTYVNLYPAFLDHDSRLEVAYTYDGLHLTKAGYEHWVKALKKEKCL